MNPRGSAPLAGAFRLRDAAARDMAAVAAIYAREVLEGSASFELTAPDEAEIARRWQAIAGGGLPYLVAEAPDGTVAGYAYAAPYRPRPAYGNTVEDSVYVARDWQGRGLGRLLLAGLIERCTAAGKRQMVAVIGDRANVGSVRLHAAFGFRYVGRLENVGFKHGRWLDTVLMQRALGPGVLIPPAAGSAP